MFLGLTRISLFFRPFDLGFSTLWSVVERKGFYCFRMNGVWQIWIAGSAFEIEDGSDATVW
ncbi:hypothetical protein RHODOSMS8_02055 [Rhodobiaceae bacterium]|nr:hypothetical protein RHODOSMS8_02055 [Rhodobiaceae bacterium]